MTIKNDEFIHIKFDYGEALQSKRDLLYVEKSLMTITTRMEKYLSLRIEELKTRLNLHKESKELAASIRKIQRNMPQVKFSKKSEEEEKETKVQKVEKKKYDESVESQLMEIQKKLNRLQN